MSSLTRSASPAFISPRVLRTTSLNVLVSARSKPATCVPPLRGRDDVDEGADLGVVAVAPAQRDVDTQLTLDVLRRHVAGVVEDRDGLGEVVDTLQPEDLGDLLVGRQEVAELRDARRRAGRSPRRPRSAPRSSRMVISRPGTMNDVWRARVTSSSYAYGASLVKVWRSGQNRMRVPVTPFLTRPTLVRLPVLLGERRRPDRRRRRRPGRRAGRTSPRSRGCGRHTTSRREESALTTERPTPCRPPVATYDPPPNLPPACSRVQTTSTPDRPGARLDVDGDAAAVVVDLGRAVRRAGSPERACRHLPAPRRRRCR